MHGITALSAKNYLYPQIIADIKLMIIHAASKLIVMRAVDLKTGLQLTVALLEGQRVCLTNNLHLI